MHQRKRHNSSKQWLYLLALSFSLATLLLLFLLPSQDRPNSSVSIQSIEQQQQQQQSKGINETTGRVRRLPRAIIIGTRKSGTRALLKFLELNPAIKSAANEVHYFDRQANYRKGNDWYRRQMPATSVHELAIEKSPAYFVTKFVPQRVAQMDPQMKLIIVFRNPVTRLISDFSQLIANRIIIDDNDEANNSRKAILWLEAAKEFERHILVTTTSLSGRVGQVDEQRQIVRTGMYSMYLEKWLSIFPRSQFHFVHGERLISEPHIELQKLEHFLNLKPVIKREHFVFNSHKGFYCISPSTIGKQQQQQQQQQQPICLSNSKGRRHVEVSRELVEKLQDFYKPYNDYLTSLTGITFD